jgi:pimeloyl-ACP methyl ester carboxylesterase
VAAPVGERFTEIDGVRIFLRERVGERTPTIWVHGNPTSSADWLPFLAAGEAPAIAPDLPGFGRSARPAPGAFDYTVGAYGRLLAKAFAELAPDGYNLVVHDWGVLGLVAAQAEPDRVRRLVAVDVVPLSSSYRWHWVARIWRRRWIGEAFARHPTRAMTDRLLRLARPGREPMPPEFVEMVLEHWDAGTSRAILALYRSADPDFLEAAGERLGEVRCPTLVLWGDQDPYISAAQGRALAHRMPGARFQLVERAGHWPWIDRPELVGEVNAFLAGD